MPEWYTPCPAITCSDVVILPLHVATVVSYMQGFLRTRTVLRVDERLTHIFYFTIINRGINPIVLGFIPCLKNETRNCVAFSCGAFTLSLHSGKLKFLDLIYPILQRL